MRTRDNHTLTVIIGATGNVTVTYAGLLALIHNQIPEARHVVGVKRNGLIASISVQYHDRQRTTMYFHRVDEPQIPGVTEILLSTDDKISVSL